MALMKIGDIVEAGTLFGGMSSEQVVLMVVSDQLPTVEFDVSVYGVNLGTLELDVSPAGDITGGCFKECGQ